MKTPLFCALAVWMIAPAPAWADSYLAQAKACRNALVSNDQAAFRKAADEILGWRSVFNTQAILAARDCLSDGFQTPWEYDTPSARFVKSSDLDPKRAAAAEKAKLAAELAKQQAVAQNLAEAEAELERAALRELYAERRMQVQLAVIEACNELFEDDKVEALTNAVCIETFTIHGLPAD